MGKVAKYARYNVSVRRQWQYFCRVLQVRLNRPPLHCVSSRKRGAEAGACGQVKHQSFQRDNTENENSQGSSIPSGPGSIRALDEQAEPSSDPLLPIPLVRTKLIEVPTTLCTVIIY